MNPEQSVLDEIDRLVDDWYSPGGVIPRATGAAAFESRYHLPMVGDADE